MAALSLLLLLVSSYASSITQTLLPPLHCSLHTRHATCLVGRLTWSSTQPAPALQFGRGTDGQSSGAGARAAYLRAVRYSLKHVLLQKPPVRGQRAHHLGPQPALSTRKTRREDAAPNRTSRRAPPRHRNAHAEHGVSLRRADKQKRLAAHEGQHGHQRGTAGRGPRSGKGAPAL